MSSLDSSAWPPVHMVETESDLLRAINTWRSAPVLGMDTESNSFHAYHEKLCLLQVSTHDEDWIVDPLALGDSLEAVLGILADPEIVKVFHSAEYDMMLLAHGLGAKVRGLFDTQVAMTLLKHKKTGLAALLESFYGVKPSKKEQRSDWGKRPLTSRQVEYARTDTHFLVDLHTRLIDELKDAGLTEACLGECDRLEREVLPPREPDPEGWKRLKGAKTLTPSQAARLRALFQWREGLGAQRDVPVFKILPNPALLSLARKPPREINEMARSEGMGWKLAKRHGAALMEVLQSSRGEEISDHFPKKVDPAERRRRRIRRENLEALKDWRKKTAVTLDLPSERLFHRRHLEKIAKELPQNSEALMRTIQMNDWQRETLERSLLQLLASLPNPEKNNEHNS